MALKVFHLLAVTAVSLTIYGYASYFNTSVTLGRPVSTPTSVDKNTSSPIPETRSEEWKQTPNNVTSNNITTSAVSSLPPKPASVTVSPVPQNVTAKPSSPDPNRGVKTQTFYVAGHQLPRPEICPDLGINLKLLTVIMSAPAHFEARMAIRLTWGHFASRNDVAIAFLLGDTTDPKLDTSIQQEGELYLDIIRGNFLDSYNNLTLKTVSMMEWVSNYCSLARSVLKTDDDMFINVPRLLAFVDKHAKDKRVVFGRLAKRWKPIRNQKSKYYVSRSQYAPSVFPDFTTGPAYVFPASLAAELYKTSLSQTYLKLEDVFMTGVVAQKLKIKRSHAAEFLNKRVPMNACTAQRAISIHMVKFGEQFDLWKKLLDGKAKCK